jgi:dienelactone hydrolase
MGNGLALTRDAGLDRYGKRFASAGIAALAFDYRSFGDSDGQPRQNLTIAQQLADWRAAIGYARSHPHLRSDAVAAWGFSFGGGHAITLSCEPLGLAAVVAVCPFVDGLRLTLALPRKNAVRLGWAALRDRTARALHLDRVWVPATTAPGSFAILTHPGAYDGFQSIHPDWTRFDNRVTAGQALTLFRYRPGRSLAKSLGPIQICAADDDLIIETTSIRRFAQGLSEVTFNSYPGGHFDLFTGQGFERALNDQLQFLRRHLRLGKERAL